MLCVPRNFLYSYVNKENVCERTPVRMVWLSNNNDINKAIMEFNGSVSIMELASIEFKQTKKNGISWFSGWNPSEHKLSSQIAFKQIKIKDEKSDSYQSQGYVGIEHITA